MSCDRICQISGETSSKPSPIFCYILGWQKSFIHLLIQKIFMEHFYDSEVWQMGAPKTDQFLEGHLSKN